MGGIASGALPCSLWSGGFALVARSVDGQGICVTHIHVAAQVAFMIGIHDPKIKVTGGKKRRIAIFPPRDRGSGSTARYMELPGSSSSRQCSRDDPNVQRLEYLTQ
jgi:hypothetical protein